MKKLGVLLAVIVLLLGGVYFATRPQAEKPVLLELTGAELQTKVDNKESFSVYVYSDTCSACKQFSPVLEAYLTKNKKEIYKIAVTEQEENTKVHEALGEKFQATPSLFSLENGSIVDYSVGAIPQEEIDNYATKNEKNFHI